MNLATKRPRHAPGGWDDHRLRRSAGGATAVLLVAEALVVAFLVWILGLAVRGQRMSLGGLPTGTMAVGAWAGGGLFALFLLVCATVPARFALRGRRPGRRGRIVLVAAAVAHGVLAGVAAGLVGWAAFGFVAVVLCLLVLVLMFPAPVAGAGAPPGPSTGSDGPPGKAPGAGPVPDPGASGPSAPPGPPAGAAG